MKNIYLAVGLVVIVVGGIFAAITRHDQVAKYEAYIKDNRCELIQPVRTNGKGEKAHQCGDKEVYINPYRLPE